MANETAPAAVRQLRALANYADRLPEIIETSKTIPPAIELRDVTAKIAAAMNLDERDLRDAFLAMDHLRTMAENLRSVEKALDRLFDFFGAAQLSAVAEKRSAIISGLALFNDDNPAAISLKARKLTFMRENLLADADILTDARPVYDSTGTQVLKWVITHSLVVTYQNSGENKRLHLALDAEDVLKIRKACDRAVIKAHTLKDTLGDKAQVLADEDAS